VRAGLPDRSRSSQKPEAACRRQISVACFTRSEVGLSVAMLQTSRSCRSSKWHAPRRVCSISSNIRLTLHLQAYAHHPRIGRTNRTKCTKCTKCTFCIIPHKMQRRPAARCAERLCLSDAIIKNFLAAMPPFKFNFQRPRSTSLTITSLPMYRTHWKDSFHRSTHFSQNDTVFTKRTKRTNRAPLLTKEGWQPLRLTGWFSRRDTLSRLMR